MSISGEYTVNRTCAPKSAAARTTFGSNTHSPERRSNPAWMPMSISFEACAQTVRACGGNSWTNFANRRMASLGFLGCGNRESRSQYRRPSLAECIPMTRAPQASAKIAGSVFDLMSKSTFRNSAGNVSIMKGSITCGQAAFRLEIISDIRRHFQRRLARRDRRGGAMNCLGFM